MDFLKKKLRAFIIKVLREVDSKKNISERTEYEEMVKVYKPFRVSDCVIGKGTYISENSKISKTKIGKFCSIGPNFMCGWGIHPIDGISTHPYFYSTLKQNGFTISSENLVKERQNISIGNDVFIGANVIILDGIKVGDGVVIGAGAVVSKDIPDFAVAFGCPIKIIKYRFSKEQQKEIKKISWWNLSNKELKKVNDYFFDVQGFLNNIDQ